MNTVLYLAIRGLFQPFFHVYFRMRRLGMEHVPRSGPVIFAANHRSFLDPFVIGTLTRRPVYYVAKKELFAHPVIGWLLNRAGRLSDRPRGGRPAGDGNGSAHSRARRLRRDLSRGHANAAGAAGRAAAGSWSPRAADRRTGRAGGGVRHRGGATWLADPPAPRHAALRCALSFPAIENPTPAQAAAVTDGSGRASCCSGTGSAGRCPSA